MNYLQRFLCLVATIAASLSTTNGAADPLVVGVKGTGWNEPLMDSNLAFACPSNQVIIGRKNSGGHNGKIQYLCGKVSNDGNQFDVPYTTATWSEWIEVAKSNFLCPFGKVMTGRHRNDDKHRYQCSNVQYKGVNVVYDPSSWSKAELERNSAYICPRNHIMFAFTHFLAPHHTTVYKCASLNGFYSKTASIKDKRYLNEDERCIWGKTSTSLCPPFVFYYRDPTLRHSFLLSVKKNFVYNTQGLRFDTKYADSAHLRKAAIFTMGIFGDIYASNVHPTRLFHHSSFFAGAPVAAAGLIFAKAGVISKIVGCSNHYMPEDDVVRQAIDSLKKQGYTRNIEYASCKSLRSDYMVLKSGDKIPPAELYFTKHESALLGPGKAVICEKSGKRSDFCRRPISLKVPRFTTIKLCFQNEECKLFKEGVHQLSDGVLKFADMKVSVHKK